MLELEAGERSAPGACQQGGFTAIGLAREHWSGTGPIRQIYRDAFTAAGLPYFNPHCFRDALVQMGERLCTTPEQFKAWSQNLGHERVLTTLTSCGKVPAARQAEVIRGLLAGEPANDDERIAAIVAATMRAIKEAG